MASPFYPGYYPGDRPYYKKPSYTPSEMGELELGKGLEYFFDNLNRDLNVPAWMNERIIADFKNSLKAQVLPGTISSEDLALYGEEAADDLPGAIGVDISLNPQDWLEDPKKQAWKTIKGAATNVLDYDDFDRQHQRRIWGSLLGDPNVNNLGAFGAGARETIGQRVLVDAGLGGAPTSSLSLQSITLPDGTKIIAKDDASEVIQAVTDAATGDKEWKKGVGIAPGDRKYRQKEVYHDVRANVLDFQINSRNVFKRESTYDKVVLSSANALKWDIRAHQEAAGGVDAWNAAFSDASYRTFDAQAGRFIAKTNIAQSMHTVNDAINGDTGIVANIDEFLMTGNLKKLDDLDMALAGAVSRSDRNIRGKNTGVGKGIRFGDRVGEYKNLDGWIAEAKRGIDPHKQFEIDELDSIMNPYKKTLGQLDELLEDGSALRKLSDKSLGRVERTRLAAQVRTQLEVISKGGLTGREIKGGNIFRKGQQRRILRMLERDILENENGFFDNPNVASGARQLRAIIPRLNLEREYSATEEFMRNMEGGRLMQVYVWGRVKQRFEVYTPAYHMGNFLKNVHHFGLKVNKYQADDNGVWTSVFGRKVNIADSSPFIAKNKFRIKHEGDRTLGIRSSNPAHEDFVDADTLKGINFVAEAGSHFKGAVEMGELYRSGAINGKALHYLLSLSTSPDPSNPSLASPLMRLLDPNSSEYAQFLALNGGKPIPFLKEEDFEKFLKNVKKFRDWAKKNTSNLRGKGEDAKTLAALALSISDKKVGRLDVTRKYVGALERVANKLDAFQTSLFNLPVVGPTLKRSLNWKYMLTERVVLYGALKRGLEKVLTKIITLLGGVVTGGVGAVILKAAGPAIAFAVRKSLDITEGLAKGLLKGDFSGFFKEMNKSFEAIMKVMITCSAVPLIIFIIMYALFGTIFTSISPADPSGGGSGVSVGAGGAGTPMPACAELTADYGNCFFGPVQSHFRTEAGKSYSTADEQGHGSNKYWGYEGSGQDYSYCGFEIPIPEMAPSPEAMGPSQADASANVCYNNPEGARPEYGWANDIFPRNCYSVYMPTKIGSDPIVGNWQVSPSIPSATRGVYSIATATGQSGAVYKMVMMHLYSISPGSYEPGASVGVLTSWERPIEHIHVELSINGNLVRPYEDGYICN